MKYYDKDARCLVCRKKGTDLHHVKARGSGGSDDKSNLMELCHMHHVGIHNMGTYSFVMRFTCLARWLTRNGWNLDKFNKRWIGKNGEKAHD